MKGFDAFKPDRSKVQQVPLSLINPPDLAMRSTVDMEKLEELLDSIEEIGVKDPVCLTPTTDHRFEIVYGHRRYLCCDRLGHETIPAIIERLDEKMKVVVRAHENFKREDVSAVDEGVYFRELIEKAGYTVEDLADMVGKKEFYVRQRLGSVNWKPEVQDAVRQGDVSFSVAREISSVKNDNLRQRMLDDAKFHGATVSKIADWKRSVDAVEHALPPSPVERLGDAPDAPPPKALLWCDVHQGLADEADVNFVRVCKGCGGETVVDGLRYALQLGGGDGGSVSGGEAGEVPPHDAGR